MKYLPIHSFLESDNPILDVRSPGEYLSGHIPGAHSFPLFSDQERAEIGTIYQQEGQREAIKRGLELVGPKMRSFIELAEHFGSDTLRVYCWRGGMRSNSMAWLLDQYGFHVEVLTGGYKVFRNEIITFFKKPLPLKILTGLTGSGKTRILREMKEQNIQVIDLEHLANHQGSSFGNQLSDSQPSTEAFQNQLYHAFSQLDMSKPIWLEDESLCIGQVHLPWELFDQMSKSPHYLLEVNDEVRINYLVEEYGSLSIERLIEATEKIRKKLGGKQADEAIQYIRSGDLKAAAAILLTYYDRQYKKSMDRKSHLVKEVFKAGDMSPEAIVKNIIQEICPLS